MLQLHCIYSTPADLANHVQVAGWKHHDDAHCIMSKPRHGPVVPEQLPYARCITAAAAEQPGLAC